MGFSKLVDDKSYDWEISLVEADSGSFQWSILLGRIIDEADHRIYVVTNREWRRVGPSFAKRSEATKFLSPGSLKEGEHRKAESGVDILIKEYHDLFSDGIETREQFHPENTPKFGRPSQGRPERMQFSATPALKTWIEQQTQSNESTSQAIYRLLCGVMDNKKR